MWPIAKLKPGAGGVQVALQAEDSMRKAGVAFNRIQVAINEAASSRATEPAHGD
jgi:hypothetical protein